MSLIEVVDVSVAFGDPESPARAVAGVSLSLQPGEILGIAGESGSGKTTLCSAIARSLPAAARFSGDILFEGRSMNAMSTREIRRMRGRDIAMVLQNPMTSLDPLFTIGNQLGEMLQLRAGIPRREVRKRSLEALTSVHLTSPETRLGQYPHELSGGMRQRILIAMTSAMSPKLLLADEPTTALDATIQEEILVLFREIRDRRGTSIVIITHDLGVIRRICDRIAIMYAGRIVEEGPVEDIFSAPQHPYTRALLASIPVLDGTEVTLKPIPGQVPKLTELGNSCAFADRCPDVMDVCRQLQPTEFTVGEKRRVFCWQAEGAS